MPHRGGPSELREGVGVVFVRCAAGLAVVVCVLATPVPASADPAPAAPDSAQPVVAEAAAPPVDDGRVESGPPVTTKSPDGWTLTISAKDETQTALAAAHHRDLVSAVQRRWDVQRIAERAR